MGASTNIQWTNQVWNPLTGCSPVSPGCTNCYAATMARRLESMGLEKYQGTAERRGKTDVFTGRINLDEGALQEPLKWKKPRMVFVNSMSDLFHKDVPDDFIDRVFDVMWLTRQHTYQVLTKRVDRMVEYVRDRAYRHSFGWNDLNRPPLKPGDVIHLDDMKYRNQCGYVGESDDDKEWVCDHPGNEQCGEDQSCHRYECPLAYCLMSREELTKHELADDHEFDDEGFTDTSDWMQLHQRPKHAMPANVWLGFSAENQETFETRMRSFRMLRDCRPYQTLFCSLEPLLGPIDFNIKYWPENEPENGMWNSLECLTFSHGSHEKHVPFLNWVIVGGESGPRSRPCHVEWVRSIVQQCQAAHVRVFVKQLGARPVWPMIETQVAVDDFKTVPEWTELEDKKGGDPSEWPEDLRVREFPND